MARDDFSNNVRDILAKRVNLKCSNPNCKKATTGPRSDPSNIVNIGVAAHITAASPGGPRYNSWLSSKERQSAENGLWLCQNCAKLIDNDEDRFPAKLLYDWKQSAEGDALAAVGGPAQMVAPDPPADININFSTISRLPDRHDYSLNVSLTNRGTSPLDPYYAELEMPACVVNESAVHPNYVADRSTRETAFFRVASLLDDVIYPGDTKKILTVNHFITNDIYMSRGTLLDTPVRARLYIQGHDPITNEKPLKELQEF